MTAEPREHVLVLASTFPASAIDPVPTFVRDQVVAMAGQHPELEFSVLAPHDKRSMTTDVAKHSGYTEYRFHYFWPRGAERLAGRGIMPALRESPVLYVTVPFLFLGEFIATLRLVRRLKPAIIYAHWFTPQGIVAAWVSKLTGVPFVFTTHASDVDVWRKIPAFGPRIVRYASRKAKAITAVSVRSRDKLSTFFAGGTSPEIHIIPMGVDLPDVTVTADERALLRTRLGFDGKVVYLFMGRLVEKKGVPYLLEALAKREDDLADWVLAIAGDGPLREEIEAKVESLGLGHRVVFTGFVTGETKDDYLRAADVFVVPSIIASDGDAEGLPVALLEGLAYSLLCVATNESGADGILTDGVDGYLCAQKDSAGLGDQLVALDSLTPEQRATLSGAARDLARTFSWDTIATDHYDVLFAPLLPAREASA